MRLFLVFFLAFNADSLSDLGLSFSPKTIGKKASYEVSFSFEKSIPGTSSVKLAFPSDVSITDSGSVSCTIRSLLYNPNSQGVSCSVSSRVYTIKGAFGTSSDYVDPSAIPIVITLPDITNPSSTSASAPVQIFIYKPDDVLEESSTDSSALKITASPGSFDSASISPLSDTIGALTSWKFSITTTFTIPAGSFIQVSFPFWNSHLGASTSELAHFIRVSNPASASESNIGTSLTSAYTSSSRFLRITGGFDSGRTGTVIWSTSSIFNPPTSDVLTGFEITVFDSYSNEFLKTSSSLAVQANTANLIDVKANAFSAVNTTVSTSTAAFLTFNLTNPTYSSVTVEVAFPSEIPISSSAIVTGINGIATSGLTYTISSNVVRITNGWSSYNSKTLVSIKIDPVTTASSTTPTGSFVVTTFSPTGQKIDTGTGGSVTARAGVIFQYLTNPFITATDLTVGGSSIYTFDIWLSHSVPAGGSVVITFPDQISITSRSSSYPCTSLISGLSAGAFCQVVSRTLTVVGGFKTDFAGGRVSFSVDQITNPATTATTGSFSFFSKTDSTGSFNIDTRTTGVTFTAAAALLVSANVSPASLVTGASSVYTFAVVTKNSIPTSGYLEVTFPSEISGWSDSSALSSCQRLSGFPSSSVTCVLSSSKVRVSGFSSPFSAGSLSWTMSGIMNPHSTAESSSFSITTLDSSGFSIDQRLTGITVSVTTANTFTSVAVSAGSLVNGALNDYSFTFNNKLTTPTSAYVQIYGPDTIALPASPTCSVISGLASVLCITESANLIRATLTFSQSFLVAGSTFAFKVRNVKNPGTTKPSLTFKVYSFTSAGDKIEKLESGLTVTTTTAATISQITIAAVNSKIAASTSYIITYLPMNTHPTGSVMLISIPSELTVSLTSCEAVGAGLSASLTCSGSGHSLTVSSAFTSDLTAATSVTLKINGITNPSSQVTTSAWSLLTKTSDGYLIDKSDTITSSFTCATTCLTCNGTPDKCTSCDQGSGYPYLYDSSCFSKCKDGFTDLVLTSEKLCVACSGICLTCSETISKCLSCDTTKAYPYLYGDTCNANCQDGYWGNGTHCNLCTNPCKTCSSASICLTCAISSVTLKQTYFLSGTCYTKCPDGYTSDLTNNICIACEDPCKTCSDSVTTCTSCKSPLKLLSAGCVGSCPTTGKYIETDTLCDPCVSPCDTCVLTSITCTSCITNYYLFDSSCLNPCPLGYAGVLKNCLKCVSPCEYCSGSQTTCTSCIEGFLLQINECVNKCSDGYFQNAAQCLKCESQCSACSGTSSTCTSCSNFKYLHQGTCLDSCPSNSYIAINRICTLCAAPCATCSGSLDFCTSCSSGMYLYMNGCTAECPTKTTVASALSNACELCNTNCKTCETTVDNCLSCESPKYLQAGSCVSSCSSGYFLEGGLCNSCDKTCSTCNEHSIKCTSCSGVYSLLGTTCVTSCPQGYSKINQICVEVTVADCTTGCPVSILKNADCDLVCNTTTCANDNGYCLRVAVSCGSNKYEKDGSCFNCLDPCTNCIGTATFCTSCKADSVSGALLYLYKGNCLPSCPAKTFVSGITCNDCDQFCQSCVTSSSTCTSCVSGYKLYNNQCVFNCPSQTSVQVDSENCYDCDGKCKFCSVSIGNCTECYSPLVLQDWNCVPYCKSGYFNNLGFCVACTGCKECTGSASFCTECQSPLFLISGKCVSVCPEGTFYGTLECETCGITCKTCSDKSSCDSCLAGFYLFENACISKCPSGYVVSLGVCVLETSTSPCNTGCTNDLLTDKKCDIVCDIENCNFDNQQCKLGSCGSGKYLSGSVCESCIYPCQECSSASVCTSCSKSVTTGELLLLKGSSCVEPSACNSGYTQIGVFCAKCSPECKDCNQKITTCVSCNTGTFLYEGTCVESCPSLKTVAKNSVCLDCSSNCLECSGTYNNCVKCKNLDVLQGSQCQSVCDSGFTVTSESPSKCQACTNNCISCSGTTSTCLACNPEMFLYGSSCLQECPKETSIQVGNNCLSCTNNCKTCRNSISQCLSCLTGFYLHETKCLSTCPEGYEPRLEECSKYCAEGCSQSQLYNGVCDKFCNTEDCLYDNSMCLGDSSCAYGQYQLGTSCANCSYPCNTCISSAYCTSCSLNPDKVQLLLYDGKCYLNCPSGTYKDLIQCKACDPSCLECSGTSKKCTSCSSDKKLYQDSCYSSCPKGKTVEIGNVCFDCDSNCLECSGTATTCTKCLTSLVLSKGSCKSQCASGLTLTDSSPTSCVPCQGCETCLGSEFFCLSCLSGKVLLDNLCLSKCPAGYTSTTANPNQCFPCETQCKECRDKTDFCTVCHSGKVLNIYNECADPPNCPSSQFSDSNGICQTCSKNCTECSGTSSNCTKCLSSYFVSSSLCLPCSSNCLNCEISASYCIECKEGFFMSNNKCFPCLASCKVCDNPNNCLSCKSGLFLIGSTCLECDDSCAECSTVKENCTSCDLGFYLSSNKCLACDKSCVGCSGSPTFCTKCSPGRFGNSQGVCTPCSSSCKECDLSSTNCISCNAGKTLIKGVCDVCKASCASCLESFTTCTSCFNDDFIISGECGKCQNNCKTCESSFTTCTSCFSGFYLSGTSCLSCDPSCKTCESSSSKCLTCDPSRTLIGSSCVVCDSNCLTCVNSKSQCSSCVKGKYLANGGCSDCHSNCTECFQSATTCMACKDGLYLSGNNCLPCSQYCKNCQIREDFCTSCPSNSTLKNGVCVVNCNEGKLQVGLECQPCNPICKTCIGSVDKCSSCSSGLVFNNSCVMECPEGHYSVKGTCIPCSVNCLNCSETSTKCKSCREGFKLVNNSCELICPDGQYEEGGICLNCDPMCSTCYKGSIKCTSCRNSTWVLMDDGVCTEPCNTGEVRVNSSKPCESCSKDCKTCSGSTSNCTTCADNTLFLYKGSCIPECPINVTVTSGKKCLDCSSECKFCLNSVKNCSLCPDSELLLNFSCVQECPANYLAVSGECIKCERFNCSESSSSNSSSNSTEKQASGSPSFEAKPVPFPFSGVSFASVGVIGLSKLASSGVQMITSTIALWSTLSAVSWVFIAGYLPAQGDSGDARRLAQDDAVGGNAVLTVAFFLVLGALVFHLVCNILFIVHYIRKVYKDDRKYLFWRKNHLKCNFFILLLTGIVSFHTIRFKFSGILGYSGFQVAYEDKSKVIKPLVFYGYISVLCTFIPIFIAELLILTDIDTYLWLWMFTLDSLILTFILGILIIFDIKKRESELMRNEYEKKLTPGQFEPAEFLESSHSIKELIEMFPHLDLTSLVPLSPTKRPVKKNISKSNPGSKGCSPKGRLQRVASFPLLVHDFVEVFPETLKMPEPPAKPDEEPFGEEILNKSEENEDLTMIVEEPDEPREFEVTFNECKKPVSRPDDLLFYPLDLDLKINEFTEIVAFTEEDEPSLEEIVLEEAKEGPTADVEQFDIELQAEPAKMSKKDLLELSSEESGSEIMGHINEEQDIELEKALADPQDPELVSVLHKPTGKRIIIRKGFKGARIVNLENKTIESLPPVDISDFDKSKTKVDEQDVRFATLTAKTGEKVRVKRSFKGARIVDLEKKVNNPSHFLIGETVRNEKDFQFTNAYPDPDDPEVVVVMHNETGEDVKVRKTFDGAQVIDEAGEPVPDIPGIDRNDYDIPKAVIDKDDVHIATLNHRLTNQKVKVRRNFRGAKIVDLERKAEFPRVLPSASEKSDEPERLSPFENDDSDDFGWITPQEVVKRPVNKKLKPINISKRNDDNYDRRKLANLANLIEDLDDDQGWGVEVNSYSSGSSEGFSLKKKQFYHNIDLNQVSVPDYDSDSFNEDLRVRRKKPKHKKKRVKKTVQPDPVRNKELEDIYLQRLEAREAREVKKRPLRMTGDPGLYEPDWERTDSGFDLKEIRASALDRTLPHAGEEIINPRFKFSTPRRD